MCGIFGYVAQPGQYADLRRLRTLATVTERRGPHSFGFAWLDARGRLRCYKQTGRITSHLGLLHMAADATMLIGHCRYATHGDLSNLNNHPHPVDGGWLVHNGIIRAHRQINEDCDLAPVSQCDSETLGLLIETRDGDLMGRVAKSVGICANGPLAMAALWRQPKRLIIARSGHPLHMGTDTTGVYFASLNDGMPKNARIYPDDRVTSFSVRGGQIISKHCPVQFDHSEAYA